MKFSIHSLKAFIALHGRAELWRLVKYGLVGGSSLAIHAALYYLLSRIIWPTGPRTPEYIMTMLCVGVYNFTLHRIWTFSVKQFHPSMVLRYAGAVCFGIVFQSGIFFVCFDVLHLNDAYAFAFSVGLSSLAQYCIQRFFTFADRTYKKPKQVQEEVPTPVL